MRENELPARHSVHSLTHQCHCVATRRKTQPKEVALNISEQYQIDILEKKEWRICFWRLSAHVLARHVGSLCMVSSLTRLYEENNINQNSTRQNISLSTSTYNTHCIYLLYIHNTCTHKLNRHVSFCTVYHTL